MLHARIATRAFNTPLLVEPAKALAFLAGLGPRVLGRSAALAGDVDADHAQSAALPARAGILAGDLAGRSRQEGSAPYPMIEGIAVIEIAGVLIHRGGWIGQSSGQTSYEGIAAQIAAAAEDPAVRGVALEIDSFGGEVAGVFDLADRIRALRRTKPVWAFVAEHAFSAGYALASQADRILLPRTGAVGSIGVVVMHADLSGQLAQDGVRVTLVHSGRHKVDGNPYEPLPEAVRDDIQREIDMLRFLFAETVAAGRGARLDHGAALATEAACFRGADAVAAGLADAVTDLSRGFAAFRQHVTRRSGPVPRPATGGTRGSSAARSQSQSIPSIKEEAPMMREAMTNDQPEGSDSVDAAAGTEAEDRETPQDEDGAGEVDVGAAAALPVAAPDMSVAPSAPASAATTTGAATAPSAHATSAQPGHLAELSARVRQEAAEIAEIAAQAGRLGVAIDAATALREGTTPASLRQLVLQRAAEAADARDIVAAPPSPVLPTARESPIVAAARRAAADPRR